MLLGFFLIVLLGIGQHLLGVILHQIEAAIDVRHSFLNIRIEFRLLTHLRFHHAYQLEVVEHHHQDATQ